MTSLLRMLLLLFCIFIVSPKMGMAQPPTRHQLVAAYVYNFAKNVEWNNETAISEFRFHLLTSEPAFIAEMAILQKTKQLRSKPIVVTTSTSLKEMTQPHVLFVGKDFEKQLPEIFDAIEEKNILLVTDGAADKRLIMINLTQSADGTLRFELNKANIINQHLRVLDDMILLGGTEIDVALLYREGQQSLRLLQKHMESVEQNLRRLETEMKEKTREVEAQKERLDIQSRTMIRQQGVLDEQSRSLHNHEVTLLDQVAKMHRQENILAEQAGKIREQQSELKAGGTILEEQQQRIQSQQQRLEERGDTIEKQQSYLWLLIVIVVLTVLLAGMTYSSYRSKHRAADELEQTVVERTIELRNINEELNLELAERQRAEALLRENVTKFKTLFEINPDAIFITDAHTLEIFDCNQLACTMNGYTREELIGRSINILHPDDVAHVVDDAEGRSRFIQSLKEHASVSLEAIHRRKDGSIFPIETSMCLLTLDGREYVMGIDRDITERKHSEQELKKYHEHLEEMVQERTEELNIAKERAESADRLKSAFLATMSHELRTPLNSIIGFTGILLNELAGPLNDEQKKQLGMAKGSAHHLLDLINDVLDISKIEAGQLVVSFSGFNFSETIRRTVSSLHPLAEKKSISMSLNMPPAPITMTSDERRVGQIMLNVINNAIKFTDRGSVKIDCIATDTSVQTSVTDTGIGIRPEDVGKLFKPFSQLDTGLTRNHEGTGLGLSICQKLIDKLHGTITVKSTPGEGSTFIITLPLHAA